VLVGVDTKDPDEIKKYTLDWSAYVNTGATVVTSTWILPSGITNVSDIVDPGGLGTTIKLSGGTAGTDYKLVNRVTTSDSETLELAGLVRVRNSTT